MLAGRANCPLAREVAGRLDTSIDNAVIYNFRDGAIFVRIVRNARGRDVFIVQPTVAGADNIMKLLLLVNEAKRAAAARVSTVVPYFGWTPGSQGPPCVAIGAKLMANLIVLAGAARVVSIDFHQHRIQGFFNVPVDHLYAAPVFTRYFLQKKLRDPVVVAPDVGSARVARGFARRLGAAFAIINKRRPAPNVAEVLNVVGEVKGRTCLVTDDMIDTGGTIALAMHALMERGAGALYGAATHALLSGDAVAKLSAAPLTKLVVTNTIDIPASKPFDGLKVPWIAPLLARAIPPSTRTSP